MKETRQQLNNLLKSMVDASEAQKTADEIEQADSLLGSVSSPAPRPELLDDIKFSMIRRQRALHQRRFLLRTMLSGAAACLLIASALFVYKLTFSPAENSSLRALENWQTLVVTSDATVEQVRAELEEISDQLYSARPAPYISPEEEFGLDEWENMQLLQEKDFWKG